MTPTQESLVAHMKTHDASLVRLPGGYWTTTNYLPLTERMPEKWRGTQTVRALVNAGILANITALPFHRGKFRLVRP